ncbi:MAG: YdcF family protein [Rickettsiales bacterium]
MTKLGLYKKASLSFVFVSFIWFLGFLWFIEQVPQTRASLPNISSQDSNSVIVVLTGGNGRLEYGLQLLAERARGGVLFVSGVGENVTVAELLQQVPEELRNKVDKLNIILGYKAKNTIGNAQEVKQWLGTNPASHIILVTSNYHMPRSLLELSTALPNILITTAPVIANDNRLVFSEYNKYLASKLRHLFISVSKSK